MTIRAKILLPMIILTIVVAAAILVSNIWQFTNYVDGVMETRVNTASHVATEEFDRLESEAHAASLTIAEDMGIKQALIQGDRDELLRRATQLQAENSVEFCTITNAKGIVTARSHDPNNFGDSITNQENIRSALAGKTATCIEQGTAVRLSMRSGVPIYNNQDQLIGVVSCGFRLDTEGFVDSVKELMDCEVTVFLGDERISTTVVKEDGTRAVGTKAAENVSQTVLAGNAYSGRAQILGRDALTRYTPIYGPDGKVLGMLFVGRYMTDENNTINSFIRTGLIITLLLLAISIPVILLVSGRIVKPINHIVEAAHALAAGDTDISLNINTKDETRKLAEAFNEMIDNTRKQVQIIEAIAAGDLSVCVSRRSDKDEMNKALRSMLNLNNEVFSQIVASAGQVSTGASQMADSSQALAQGATEQSTTVELLSQGINEVNIKIKESAEMAGRAASQANMIKSNAQKGSEQMGRMVQAVREINEASQSINKIIKVIDDIAFQTNILALNAAVEAARAGQHGKGFAVVAEEVRHLAAKSAEAAKDTGALIENSITKAELGANIADETAASLTEIVTGINESNRIVEEIAQISGQQDQIVSQINSSIRQVTEVVQQNSAMAEENAAVSQQMNSQSALLQDMVSRFKLYQPAGAPALKPAAAPAIKAAGSKDFGKY